MSEEQAKEANPDELEIVAGGKTWKLRSPGFQIRLDAEEEVRKARRTEFREVMLAIATLPPDARTTPILSAFDNLMRNISVSVVESSQWLASASGELFQIQKALQAADSSVTPEQAREFLGLLTVQQNNDIGQFLVRKLTGE